MSRVLVQHAGSPEFPHDVVIVGGGGHVGLPLAIVFADRGASVVIHDICVSAVDRVNSGELPCVEPGAAPMLHAALAAGRIRPSADPAVVACAEQVIMVIGTPVDEHLSPDPKAIPSAIAHCTPSFRDGQLLVLQSPVYPGVTALVERMVADLGVDMMWPSVPSASPSTRRKKSCSTCLRSSLPRTDRWQKRAEDLFRRLTSSLVPLEPDEAELAKLFTTTWRYINSPQKST